MKSEYKQMTDYVNLLFTSVTVLFCTNLSFFSFSCLNINTQRKFYLMFSLFPLLITVSDC